jgi:predicted CXXCH cytochrome family protein
MSRRAHLVAGALAVALAAGGAASSPLAPLPPAQARSTHSPYEMGECRVCHERNDRADPGPVLGEAPQLCLECHDDFAGVKKGHPNRGACTRCHSPHNSAKPKLRL